MLLLVGLLAFVVFLLEKGGDLLSMTPEGQRVLAYVRGVASEVTVWGIGDGLFLREDAAASFQRLKSLATANLRFLKVNSAFRTMEEQTELQRLYEAGQGAYAATPGYSNHQNGIALDIEVHASRTSSEYLWLSANAPSFGWVNTGAFFSPPEYWHWEYQPARDLYASPGVSYV